MPSLAGFFSRKNKSSARSNGDTPTTSLYSNGTTDLNSAHSSSPTTEYVTADRSLPSSPNGGSSFQLTPPRGEQTSSVYPSLAASSNKLRLPFTRKKASAATSSTSIATTSRGSHFGSPPMPSYMARDSMSAASDSEAADMRRLRPPPSKSAIFAAYGDPHSALSTRSLPNERPPSIEITPIPPPVPPKKPGFFHWSKSSPSSPQTTLRKSKPAKGEVTTPPSDSSFNLKSFRHVRPPSPNTSDASLPLPIPRPRGNSTTSESSQRISVAAFREAQARRSTTESPIPSPRAPSPLSPQLPNGYLGDANRGRPGPRPQQSLPTAIGQGSRQTSQKHRTSALAYTSDSGESSSEDEDSDEPDRSGLTRRKHTITKRNNGNTPTVNEPIKMRTSRSEAGHGSASYHTPPTRREIVPAPRSHSSHILMSQFPGPSKGGDTSGEAIPRSQSSLGFNTGVARPRATVSASAISPSAAAKRASIIAAANAGLGSKQTHTRHSSIPPAVQPKSGGSSSSSNSDSEDDAPLATLLNPRRPGSAMSSASNNVNASRSNVNLATRSTSNLPKPLIDINELTRGRRPTNAQNDDGFTHGATLIGRGITNSPGPISPVAPIPTSKSPPTHFVSPPASPTKEHSAFLSSQSSTEGSTRSTIRSISVLTSTLQREKSPEQRRDVLTERLTRVVQLKAGSGSSSGSGSTSNSTPSPAPTPAGKGSVGEQIRARTQSNSPPKVTASTRTSADVPVRSLRLSHPSPPEEDLASMLGASISLISRNGESDTDSDESESDSDETDKEEAPAITPIPIKERAPPPAFSVTSRPQVPKNNDNAGVSSTPGTRQRSSTLVSSSSSSPFGTPMSKRSPSPVKNSLDSSKPTKELVSAMKSANGGQRQRSTTMHPQAPMPSTGTSIVSMPSKPFAMARRDSPASSTGDSSSGRAPFTPKDGSEVGSTAESGIGRSKERGNTSKKDGWSGGVSGLPLNGTNGTSKHIKRRSVSFEDDLRDSDPVPKERETRLEGEERRRERRRSEAKAAIELGNVINGRGPLVEDDDDDLPINQTLGGGRMPVVNPMMAMGGSMPMQMGFGGSPAMNPGFMGGWPQQPNPQLLSPAQFMPPAPDPNFMAAHQQAMMYAKHAYQMAVAQQAMAAAGDEWERGSTVGGFGGGSVYGGASPSVIGSPYGMGMGMSGMGIQSPSNGWSTGSVVFPPTARSMYGGGISGTRSEYGGGGGGGRWTSSRSSYGENFGPPDRSSKASASQGRPVYGQRDSGYFPPVPPIPQNTGSPAGKGSPRSRTTSQPASPGRTSGGGVRRAPPPSSWKAGV
ncbi:hypothetical protein BDZ94DRAFT_1242627 [Collybia nuda]|uniref:Uncharacterized protein n=1 Tax=Collybia nuda TaxID=64659 RepID=A0A9P5YGK7_9AGAR|nr:hypothetical protein BDZ94DRAFT_1242627 [Collybia nuda]